jgi:uncharacterized protein YndB with AHSA1/START domain
MSPEKDELRSAIVQRYFNAPVALVWRAWTEAELMAQWWSPKGFSTSIHVMEPEVGGRFHYSLIGPNGMAMHGLWIYEEVDPPEQFVALVSWADAEGRIIRAPISATWPMKLRMTVRFEHTDNGTLLTITSIPEGATEEELRTFNDSIGMLSQGYEGPFEKLIELLHELQQ